MKNNSYRILIVVLLICTGLVLPGCTIGESENTTYDPGYIIETNASGQSILTVDKDKWHFSLTIPEGFEFDEIDVDNSVPGGLLFVGLLSITRLGYDITLINISVDDYDETNDSKDTYDHLLSWNQGFKNYKLIEESTITVAGVTGYKHAFYWDTYDERFDSHLVPPKEEPELETNLWSYVLFDHSGFSWDISLVSDPSQDEWAFTAFDKVLQSFKVLD